MSASAEPTRPLPLPGRERCCNCGGGGLTSHGDTCPSCHGLGHSHSHF